MNLLVFAPHRDDEILGLGGTILKRRAKGDRITVCVVTGGAAETFEEYTGIVHREMEQAQEFCGIDSYVELPFIPALLENESRVRLNQAMLEVVQNVGAEEVYIPFWGDMQKDHVLTAEAAMVVLRDKYKHPVRRIYAYETLSETGINLPHPVNAFIPNVYEDITDYLEGKKQAMLLYQSQVQPFPDLRSPEAIEALARFRGATVNLKAAEAFMLIREIKTESRK